jgi:hypothetical protein
MNRYTETSKFAAPVFLATRLLNQVRERIHYLYFTLHTEKAYVYWARFFIHRHGHNDVRGLGVKRTLRSGLSFMCSALLLHIQNSPTESTNTHEIRL